VWPIAQNPQENRAVAGYTVLCKTVYPTLTLFQTPDETIEKESYMYFCNRHV